MSLADPLDPNRKFFARLVAFDLECPRCASVFRVRSAHKTRVWSARTSTFKCEECKLTLQLGMVAWPTRWQKRDKPPDQIPTPEQALKIRQIVGGWWAPHARKHREPANILHRKACTCLDEPSAVWCPAHGAPIGAYSTSRPPPSQRGKPQVGEEGAGGAEEDGKEEGED